MKAVPVLFAALVAFVVLSGAGGHAASSTPRCKASALRIAVRYVPPGGMRRYRAIVFRNAGKHTCHLRGYPGVSFLGKHGKRIGKPAKRDHGATAHTVRLRPGHRAHATFTLPESGCSGEPHARRVEVYPPGSRAALTARYTGGVCKPLVEPVAPGA